MNFNYLKKAGLIAVLATWGCGSSESDDESESVAQVDVTTGTALNVGRLALGSIDPNAMGLGSSGLRSVGNAQVPGIKLQNTETKTPSSRDANCSDSGDPMSSAGKVLETGDEGFAETSLYCAIAFNTGSPDSVLGAISIPGVLSCELERAGAWQSDSDFTSDGNAVGDVTITLSENCAESWLVERLADGSDGVFPLSNVTLTALAETHGYDKKISFSFGNEDPESFFIRSSDNFIAARADNWAFSVDLTSGEVRYETLGESTSDNGEGGEDKYVRRIRLLVQGVLTSTGAFSSIAKVEALKLEGNGIDADWRNLVTISGVPDIGLATALYTDANGSFSASEDGCAGTDCSAITRITATESQIDSFHSNAASDFVAHDAKEGIIDFEKVDLTGNVTYSSNR